MFFIGGKNTCPLISFINNLGNNFSGLIMTNESHSKWELAYKYGNRSWFNTNTEEFIKITGAGNNHALMVFNNPELFDVSVEDIAHLTKVRDRDPYIMSLVCNMGWIRIAGQDRNNPQRYMIFEGNNMDDIHLIVRRFYSDMARSLENVTVKIRTGINSGMEYPFRGVSSVTDFVRNKTLPEPKSLDSSGSFKIK